MKKITLGVDWSDNNFIASEEWLKNSFGTLQNNLRDERVGRFVIDLSKVQWVDPLPLMALLAETVVFIEKGTERSLLFKLGRIGAADPNDFSSRTRKYLAKHHWIKEFAAIHKSKFLLEYYMGDSLVATAINGSNQAAINMVCKQIESEDGSGLLYESEVLIRPMVINGGNWEDAVARAVDNVDEIYFSKSAMRKTVRGTVLQRLRAVMRELVRNAIEHAYRSDNGGRDGSYDSPSITNPVVIYARTRRKSEREKSQGQEKVPKTKGWQLEPLALDQNWIEACVLDVGNGLWDDAEQWETKSIISEDTRRLIKKARKAKNPGSALSGLMWQYNLSRYSRDPESLENTERGKISGLMYLNRILGVSGDWSHWYSGSAWRYSRHSISKASTEAYQSNLSSGHEFLGTCYRVSLNTINENVELSDEWFLPEREKNITEKILDLLNEDSILIAKNVFNLNHLLDLRMGAEEATEARSSIEQFFKQKSLVSPLIRAPRSFDKNLFLKCINEWLKILGDAESKNGIDAAPVMVIADVSRAQALNLQLGIELANSDDSPEWIRIASETYPIQATLVVICDDLACFAVDFNSKKIISSNTGISNYSRFWFSVTATSKPLGDYISNSSKAVKSINPSILISTVIKRLRRRDSLIFWSRVKNLNDSSDACLWGNVQWNSTDVHRSFNLDHYLDFSVAMKDRELAKILRRSLRRILALFPGEKIVCMDSLTEGLVADARWWFFGTKHVVQTVERNQQPGTILVGSVRVTGGTLRKYLELPGANVRAIIDCFVQPAHIKKSINMEMEIECPELIALEWIPPKNKEESACLLEQEPGTPFIRRVNAGMNSYVSIPDFESVGSERTPNEMYKYFAFNGLIKLGHWSLGDKHSLLEVDTSQAIQNFAATYEPKIDDQFFGWLKTSLLDIERSNSCLPIVCYLPNRLTQSIVWHLRPMMQSINFVPIQLFAGIAGGIGQISDMSLMALDRAASNPIKAEAAEGFSTNVNAINSSKIDVPIVVLDVGFVSKKTLRHVRRQLSMHGCTNTIALGLLNRSSSPAHAGEIQKGRLETYWRWNVPILGRSAQCSICAAIKVYEIFQEQNFLSHRHLNVSMKATKADWESVSMNEMWKDRGVLPTFLAKPKAIKLGFRDRSNLSAGEQWHYVNHTQSTTLSAHYIELSRYSGNEGYLLKAIKDDPGLFTSEIRLECLSTFIVMCGNSLSESSTFLYLSELVRAVYEINAEMFSIDSKVESGKTYRRIEQLVGLATLSIFTLNEKFQHIVGQLLEQYESTNASVAPISESRMAPSVRVFRLACVHRRNAEARFEAVNFRNERSIWTNLKLYFGRGPRHRGYAIEALEDFRPHSNPQKAAALIFQVSAFIASCGEDLLEKIGIVPIQEFEIRCAGDCAEFLAELSRNISIGRGDVSLHHQNASRILNAMRNGFQEHVLRCSSVGQGSDLVTLRTTVNRAFIEDCGLLEKAGYFGNYPVVSTTKSIVWCLRVRGIVRGLIENASREGISKFHYTDSKEIHQSRKVWIKVSDHKLGLEIFIENAYEGEVPSAPNDSCPEFLLALGGSRDVCTDVPGWFSVKILLPSIESFE